MKRMSRHVVVLFIVVFLIGTGGAVDVRGAGESLSDYSSMPPFLGADVKPNILLIFDRSSSMLQYAHKDDVYDPGKKHAGYFQIDKCYIYSGGLFTDPQPKNPKCANLPDGSLRWDGDFLNWLTMRRLDIGKWALTGGECAPNKRKDQNTCEVFQAYVVDDLYQRKHNLDGVAPLQYNSSSALRLSVNKGTFYFTSNTNTPAPPPTGTSGRRGGRRGGRGGSGGSGSGGSGGSSGSNQTHTFNVRVDAGASPQTGVIQRVGDRARMGLMVTTGSDGLIGNDRQGRGEGVYLDDYSRNGSTLVTNVDTMKMVGGTPLYQSMYDAARYFAQIEPSKAGNFEKGYHDPYCFYGLPAQKMPDGSYNGCAVDKLGSGSNATYVSNTKMGQYVSCCRSFVLMFSDGDQSSTNEIIPGIMKDLAHAPNIADHASDNHDKNSGALHYLDDVAYWAHITDLRPETGNITHLTGGPNDVTMRGLSGTQNLTVFTFHAFGDEGGKSLLQDAAKVGGFKDSDDEKGAGYNRPDKPFEWDRVNNLDRTKQEPDKIPDNYFQADDSSEIQRTLQSALDAILQQSAAGTAVSVLASSSSGEGAIYQSYFYPKKNTILGEQANWIGYLQSIFLDNKGEFREDTDGDAALNPAKDSIIETYFATSTQTTMATRWTVDAKGNKIASSTIELNEIKPIWEAGKLLADRAESTRKIFTWIDSGTGDGYVDAAEVIDFSSGQSGTLRPYLRATSNAHSTNIIDFIRGKKVAAPGFRARELDGATWKLGDILYSDPTLVGPPVAALHKKYNDASYAKFFLKYQNRRRVVYVGANDGMLHAFNAGFFHPGDNQATVGINTEEHGYFTKDPLDGTFVKEAGMAYGKELWAFIPQELLPHLQWLTTEDYDRGHHVSFVDGSPRIAEVQVFKSDTTHPNGWGTILIGSMRMGGGKISIDFDNNGKTDLGEDRFRSAYFALDITDPEQDPTLLWVFKDNDLGFTMSHPTVARLSPDRWFAVFGSGPTTYKGERQNGDSKFGPTSLQGHVYMIDLKKIINKESGFLTKKDIKDIDPNDLNAFMGDPGSFDAERDYVSDVIYMGKTFGSFGSWKGKVYRILTRNNIDPGQWSITTLLNPEKPVLTRPTVSMDTKMQPWVYFGTGRLFTAGPDSDTVDKAAQALYGIKEGGSNGCWDTVGHKWKVSCSGPPNPVTDLFNSGEATVYEGGGVSSGGSKLESILTLVSDKIDPPSGLGGTDGWVLNLANGERILQNVAVLAGVVLVPSYTPKEGLNEDPTKSDTCNTQGTSSLYGLQYQAGTAFASARQQAKGVFYRPEALGGSGNGGGAGSGGSGSGGSDPPPDPNKEVKKSVYMDLGIASEVTFIANTTDVTGISQSSTGTVQRTYINLGIDPSGVQIFREGKN
jgi:type IV pilus assembly protein PilY1